MDIPILCTPPPVPPPPTDPKDIALIRRRAEAFFERMVQRQHGHLHLEINKNMLHFFKNEIRHVVIAGATGDGLGFALACALSLVLTKGSSLTVIGSDPDNSFNYFTGKIMDETFRERKHTNKSMEETFKNRHFTFHWFDGGFDVKRTGKQKKGLTIANKEIERTLREIGAQNIIYINTVFRLNSGLMPNFPTVYVPDLNDRGELVQYELQPLTPRQIKENKYIMGDLAVRFPQALRRRGLTISHEHFIDHRGSQFRLIQDPESEIYGRWGPIATCFWYPKQSIDEYVTQAHAKGKRSGPVLIHELPTAWSSSMRHMPGARLIAKIFEQLALDRGKQPLSLPLFAIDMLQAIGDSDKGSLENIRVKYDQEEWNLDEELFQIISEINNPGSQWYYKKWVVL